MKKSSSLPKYKRFLIINNSKTVKCRTKRKFINKRSFSQGNTITSQLNKFLVNNYFFENNLFHFKERNYYLENNFIAIYKLKKKNFKKEIKQFFHDIGNTNFQEKLKTFIDLKRKKKILDYLKFCLNKKILFSKKKKKIKKNYLKIKFECKICSKLIYSFLFENHIKNCYQINLSKEELKNINREILNICKNIENKEKNKFLQNLNKAKNKIERNKMKKILTKTLYVKKRSLKRSSISSSSLLLPLNKSKNIYEKFSELSLKREKVYKKTMLKNSVSVSVSGEIKTKNKKFDGNLEENKFDNNSNLKSNEKLGDKYNSNTETDSDLDSDEDDNFFSNRKFNFGNNFKNDKIFSNSSDLKIIEKNMNIGKELIKEKSIRNKLNNNKVFNEDDDENLIKTNINGGMNNFSNINNQIKKEKNRKFFNSNNDSITSEEKKYLNYFSDKKENNQLLKKNSLIPKRLSRFGKKNFNLNSSEDEKTNKSLTKKNSNTTLKKIFETENNNQNNFSLQNYASINKISPFNTLNDKFTHKSLQKNRSSSSLINCKNLNVKLNDSLSCQKNSANKKLTWKKIKGSKTSYKFFSISNSNDMNKTISHYLLINDLKNYKSQLLNFPFENNYINDKNFFSILNENFETLNNECLDDLKNILKLVKKRIVLVKNILKFRSNNLSKVSKINKNKIKKFKSFSEFNFVSNKTEKIISKKKSQISLNYLKKKNKIQLKNYMVKDISLSDTEFYFEKKELKIYEDKLKIIKFDDFEIIRELGKGAYGKVYLVKKKNSETTFAMKVIKFKKNIDKKFLENLQNEINILSVINGKYLARAYFSFLENDCLFIIMEYMIGGDIRSYLESWTLLDKDEAKYVIAQLILGVKELHEKKIIHRDLKPENLLINENGQIKIADFGLSEIHKDFDYKDKIENNFENLVQSLLPIKKNNLLKLKRIHSHKLKINQKFEKISQRKMSQRILNKKPNVKIIGTPDYISPEVINKISLKEENKVSIDWWSVGCLIYEFLVGIPPFSGNSVEEIFDNIKYNKIIWPDIGEEENMMSKSCYNLICNFLNRDVEKRWGKDIEEIKNHSFFEGLDWDKLLTMKSPMYLDFKDLHIKNSKDEKHSIFFKTQIEKNIKNKLKNRLVESFSLNRIDLLHQNNLKILNDFKTKVFLNND